MAFTFNKCNCLKSVSVGALYRLLAMIRRARFCSFDMRSQSKPQFIIPNWRCGRINDSYINLIAEKGKYRLSLFITLSVRDILLAILQFFVCVWIPFHVFIIINPRKLNSVTCSIKVLFMIKRGVLFPVIILLAVMKYHKFSFLYIERQLVHGKPVSNFIWFWIN